MLLSVRITISKELANHRSGHNAETLCKKGNCNDIHRFLKGPVYWVWLARAYIVLLHKQVKKGEGVGVMVLMTVGEAHPLDLVALLQGLSILVHGLIGQGTLCLEPHALHLIQVLHC